MRELFSQIDDLSHTVYVRPTKRIAYLDEVGDQRRREHVVDPVVFVAEHVVKVAATAVRRQDEDVASVDTRTEKGNQVLVANLAHLRTNEIKCILIYGKTHQGTRRHALGKYRSTHLLRGAAAGCPQEKE